MDISNKGVTTMEMEEDSTTSTAQLHAALSRAQAQMRHASKDRSNDHLRYTYATLASVWDAVRAPLTDNELAIVQRIETEHDAGEYNRGRVLCTTILVHSAGASLSSTISVPYETTKGLNAVQAIGRAATYARRYGLSAMVGVAPADDDDGVGAAPAHQEPPRPPSEADRKRADDTVALVLKCDDRDMLTAAVGTILSLPASVRQAPKDAFKARCGELGLEWSPIVDEAIANAKRGES